jgi:hypothetical protein
LPNFQTFRPSRLTVFHVYVVVLKL